MKAGDKAAIYFCDGEKRFVVFLLAVGIDGASIAYQDGSTSFEPLSILFPVR